MILCNYKLRKQKLNLKNKEEKLMKTESIVKILQIVLEDVTEGKYSIVESKHLENAITPKEVVEDTEPPVKDVVKDVPVVEEPEEKAVEEVVAENVETVADEQDTVKEETAQTVQEKTAEKKVAGRKVPSRKLKKAAAKKNAKKNTAKK